MKNYVVILVSFFSILSCGFKNQNQTPEKNELNVSQKPNIVIIVSDDQGYADAGFQPHHPADVITPEIDKLAKDGIVFTNGYASAYVCAPTRAGLLTGRYQQRFGFYEASDSRQGMPLEEKTIAEYLREEGYVTGIFGKWHLGLDYEYRPLQRGFDEFYGFLGHGAHDYFDLKCNEQAIHNCIYRNNEIIDDEGYLTDNIARLSCDFINKAVKESKPFFLYVPFNAVHWPLQAPAEDIQQFNTGDKDRDVMLAMLSKMDIAVGLILTTLKNNGIYKNTLIFYFSDNGGARKIHASNAPLRDYKQSTYEGGIRVPFIISWHGKFSPAVIDEPVITLDVLPTIMEILNMQITENRLLDGKSILPAIEKKLKAPLHERFYWDGNEEKWAVREGQYKLIKNSTGDLELYDLFNDISESENIISSLPEKAKQLEKSYYDWRNEMGQPM